MFARRRQELRRQFLEWREGPGTAIKWPTGKNCPLLAPGVPASISRSRCSLASDALVRILEESPQLGKRACAAGPILPRADAAWMRTDASASDSRTARWAPPARRPAPSPPGAGGLLTDPGVVIPETFRQDRDIAPPDLADGAEAQLPQLRVLGP